MWQRRAVSICPTKTAGQVVDPDLDWRITWQQLDSLRFAAGEFQGRESVAGACAKNVSCARGRVGAAPATDVGVHLPPIATYVSLDFTTGDSCTASERRARS